MGKRARTSHRFEELYELAVTSQAENWRWPDTCAAIEEKLAHNQDLVDDKATETARDEARIMAHPRLRGQLAEVYDLTTQTMDAEPPGTNKRFNHVFVGICRRRIKGKR
jgi:hypothetical protein